MDPLRITPSTRATLRMLKNMCMTWLASFSTLPKIYLRFVKTLSDMERIRGTADSRNMNSLLELPELIKARDLFDMQERFSELLGFNVAFADLHFDSIRSERSDKSEDRRLSHVGTTCALLNATHRGRELCHKSDEDAGREAMREGRTILYRCQSYCSNFVIPIKVGEDVIGFLYSGQFFVYEPEDRKDQESWEKFINESNISIIHDPIGSIKPGFFHEVKAKDGERDARPTDTDLRNIAKKANIIESSKVESFVTTFRDMSNPGHPDNLVKDYKEIMGAIKTFSKFANLLSEECNTKYVLTKFFEICQEIEEISFSWRERKSIGQRYDRLTQRIKESLNAVGQAPFIIRDVVGIYEQLLKRERRLIRRTRWINRHVLRRKIPLEIDKLLTEIETLLKSSSQESITTRIEGLSGALLKAKESHERLLNDRSPAGIASMIIAIASIALAIYLGLKQLGVV